MRYVAAIALALGLAAPAFAAEQIATTDESKTQQSEPVLMTEAELDGVVGGQLIEVEIENNNVGVVATVTAAANVLTSESSAVARGGEGRINFNR
jgi:hypothetical protein